MSNLKLSNYKINLIWDNNKNKIYNLYINKLYNKLNKNNINKYNLITNEINLNIKKLNKLNKLIESDFKNNNLSYYNYISEVNAIDINKVDCDYEMKSDLRNKFKYNLLLNTSSKNLQSSINNIINNIINNL
jgi:flagellar basal body rod protein FlgB